MKQHEGNEATSFREAMGIQRTKNVGLEDRKGLDGFIQIIARDANGKIKAEREIHNLITSAGKAGAASRLNGSGAEAAFTYLALGIGTTAANVTDTTLVSEIVTAGLERAAATCTRDQTTVANDTAVLDKTWSVSDTKAVTECGILNAASTGTLLGRQVFTAVNVVSGDSLQVIYRVAVS